MGHHWATRRRSLSHCVVNPADGGAQPGCQARTLVEGEPIGAVGGGIREDGADELFQELIHGLGPHRDLGGGGIRCIGCIKSDRLRNSAKKSLLLLLLLCAEPTNVYKSVGGAGLCGIQNESIELNLILNMFQCDREIQAKALTEQAKGEKYYATIENNSTSNLTL